MHCQIGHGPTASWFCRIFWGNFWNASQNCLPTGRKEEAFICQPKAHCCSRVAPWELNSSALAGCWNSAKWVLRGPRITARLKQKVYSGNPKGSAIMFSKILVKDRMERVATLVAGGKGKAESIWNGAKGSDASTKGPKAGRRNLAHFEGEWNCCQHF